MLGPTRPPITDVVGSIIKLETEERRRMTSEGHTCYCGGSEDGARMRQEGAWNEVDASNWN